MTSPNLANLPAKKIEKTNKLEVNARQIRQRENITVAYIKFNSDITIIKKPT